jgi:hypothetical protein
VVDLVNSNVHKNTDNVKEKVRNFTLNSSFIDLFLEKMRRCTIQNNGHTGGANEFHIDVPPMPIWQNGPMPPVHVQIVPTNINNHHAGIDHLINTSGDQMDRKKIL